MTNTTVKPCWTAGKKLTWRLKVVMNSKTAIIINATLGLHWAVTSTSQAISWCWFNALMKKYHHKKLGIINFYKEKMQSLLFWVKAKICFPLYSIKLMTLEIGRWLLGKKALASLRISVQIPITHIKAGSFCNSVIPPENWKDCVTAPHCPFIFISKIHLKGAGGRSKDRKTVSQGPSSGSFLVYLPLWRSLFLVSGSLLSYRLYASISHPFKLKMSTARPHVCKQNFKNFHLIIQLKHTIWFFSGT